MENLLTFKAFQVKIKPQTNWLRKLAYQLQQFIDQQGSNELEGIAKEIIRTANVLDGKEPSKNSKKLSKGQEVAELAEKHYGHKHKPGGKCLWAVQNILDKAGIMTTRVPSAYLAEKVFDTSTTFNRYYKRLEKKPLTLDNLPPGSIIVFNYAPGYPHGHIEIKATTGKAWISDYKQYRRLKYAGQDPSAIYIPR